MENETITHNGWHKDGLDAILDASNFLKKEGIDISDKMLKFLEGNEELATFSVSLRGTAFYMSFLKLDDNYHLLGSEDENSLKALVDYFNKKEGS
jgi:hypothetical protein